MNSKIATKIKSTHNNMKYKGYTGSIDFSDEDMTTLPVARRFIKQTLAKAVGVTL